MEIDFWVFSHFSSSLYNTVHLSILSVGTREIGNRNNDKGKETPLFWILNVVADVILASIPKASF